MKIALIVAMDKERGIGRNNGLMWHLPADMNFFKETTLWQIVVMGRKNYESIPAKFRPLPNRENVILTRNKNFKADGCIVMNSIQECMLAYQDDRTSRTMYIIGGGEIYKLALEADLVDEMYITYVDQTYGADTFFPEFDHEEWLVETIYSHERDYKHEARFTIKKFTRK